MCVLKYTKEVLIHTPVTPSLNAHTFSNFHIITYHSFLFAALSRFALCCSPKVLRMMGINISVNCILRLSIIKCHILINILKIQPDPGSSAALSNLRNFENIAKSSTYTDVTAGCAWVYLSHVFCACL